MYNMYIPQYPQVADAQRLAAQKTIDTQQKQALMFSGGNSGIGYRAPDMGGNNRETQALVNKLTKNMVNQHTQAAYDYRGTGTGATSGGKGKYRTYRNKRTHHKKCKTRRKKHNKRISKRRHYKQ